MKKVLFSVLLFFISYGLIADEGMWIPLLLKDYNYEDMVRKGFKLSAEEIYDINNASMKDAIVIFGGGCTGEMISNEGLLITNHHCGYGYIQKHSSVEHDYLTDGFWAMSRDEELSNPGLKVTFLIRMEDVSERVLRDVTDEMNEEQRNSIIEAAKKDIVSAAKEGTHYQAEVKPFFHGNQYFLFVNEVFEDVRLVGAPPSSIGKFGGDTDNWMWPRHTGDFSLFRVYCAPDGSPASYSEENIPLKPKKHFPISLKGYKPGDFTMVFGYPGSTTQYIPSYAVDLTMNVEDPALIEIREAKLNVIKAAMNTDTKIRIQYSSKAASVANGWKKWIGEVRGLKRLNALEKKIRYEKAFTKWAQNNRTYSQKYGNILQEYQEAYNTYKPYRHAILYVFEAGFGPDAIVLARKMSGLYFLSQREPSQSNIDATVADLKNTIESHFKDYHEETDKKIMAEMIKLYYENVESNLRPEYLQDLSKYQKKFDNYAEAYAEAAYKKSVLANKESALTFLDSYKAKHYKKLAKDPIFSMYLNLMDLYQNKIASPYNNVNYTIDSLNRVYMEAQMLFLKDSTLYPDANFTLRITYGEVDGYYPADGVEYKYYTTLEGIMEKDNPEIYDYDVPDKLKDLFYNKNYGKYADSDGTMHVAFIATNHTSGGNSGSPVIDGNGNLIGVNFDRNWEGTMSDIMYDPDMCRNISIDIRYALFIVDKFAGATHLIDEMTIIE
ncbi:MAG TPA: S46 family peptidase [Bacteroidales bacterium]|nr:S46 family peptidase [Bacteroidales bacterium]